MIPRPLSDTVVNELANPLQPKKPLSTETMSLIVDAEKARRQRNSDIKFNCYVVDADTKDQLPNFLNMLRTTAASAKEPVRLQLLIKMGAHYTAIDFRLSKEGNAFFVLDAGGDGRGVTHYNNFSEVKDSTGKDDLFHPYKRYVTVPEGKNGSLQKDYHNCPAFALDHACQVSRMADIYETLAKVDEDNSQMIGFKKLPPQFVWNAQSLSWLENYKKLHPEKIDTKIPGMNITFNEYLKAGLGQKELKGQMVPANNSVERSFKVYQEQAQAYIQNNMKVPLAPQARNNNEFFRKPQVPKLPLEKVKQNFSEGFSDKTEKDIRRDKENHNKPINLKRSR